MIRPIEALQAVGDEWEPDWPAIDAAVKRAAAASP
jgi:hypothetical protein